MIEINNIKNFNLHDTITCGQIFRYEIETDSSYTVILKDRVVNIKQVTSDKLKITSNKEKGLEKIIRDYFDLDRDYDSINKYLIEKDSRLEPIVNACLGLKMIKQDPFETLIEYIISSNNRVTSIKNSLNLISKKYGEVTVFNNKKYYLFPTYNALKNVQVEELRNYKVGFRDKYLKNIINAVNSKELDLNDFYKISTKEAMDKLIKYNGIGPKVASCILLFAYQKFDVFPVDTWVKKMMKDEYQLESQKEIIEYASKTYDKYSAIAIQYMFHAKRNK